MIEDDYPYNQDYPRPSKDRENLLKFPETYSGRLDSVIQSLEHFQFELTQHILGLKVVENDVDAVLEKIKEFYDELKSRLTQLNGIRLIASSIARDKRTYQRYIIPEQEDGIRRIF